MQGEQLLMARACAEWAQSRAEAIGDAFKAAADLATLDVENVGDLTQGGALQQVWDYIKNDPAAWVQYALGLAGQGTLLVSDSDPVTWYVVTHKAPCAGARTTVGGGAGKRAYALGVALASPAIRAQEPNLSAQGLRDLEQRMRNKASGNKMRGLQPVIGQIVAGYEEGLKIWSDVGATDAGKPTKPDMSVRAQRLARKFKTDKTGGTGTSAEGGLGGIATAVIGYLVAGPIGGIAGLWLGSKGDDAS